MADLDVVDLDADFDSTVPDSTVPDSTVPDSTASLVPADSGDLALPLTRDEAQHLTEQIRSAGEVVWVLMLRAHEGKAWEALGYERWDDYVAEEFSVSRTHGYRLLNAAKFERDLLDALPAGADVRITEKVARDLKDIAGEVIGEVAERTDGLEPDLAGEIASEVLAEKRQQVKDREQQRKDDRAAMGADGSGYSGDGSGNPSGNGHEAPSDFDLDFDGPDLAIDEAALRRATTAAYDLVHTATSLSSMPEAAEVIEAIPLERRYQLNASLPTALAWLTEFVAQWQSAPWQQTASKQDVA